MRALLRNVDPTDVCVCVQDKEAYLVDVGGIRYACEKCAEVSLCPTLYEKLGEFYDWPAAYVIMSVTGTRKMHPSDHYMRI